MGLQVTRCKEHAKRNAKPDGFQRRNTFLYTSKRYANRKAEKRRAGARFEHANGSRGTSVGRRKAWNNVK
jgi:hypothetical protein